MGNQDPDFQRPHCLGCDYDLSGIRPDRQGWGTCPECGQRGPVGLRPLTSVYTPGGAMWASCWPAMAAWAALAVLIWVGSGTALSMGVRVASVPCLAVAVWASAGPPWYIFGRLGEQWRHGYRPGPRPVWVLLASLACNAAVGLAAIMWAGLCLVRLNP